MTTTKMFLVALPTHHEDRLPMIAKGVAASGGTHLHVMEYSPRGPQMFSYRLREIAAAVGVEGEHHFMATQSLHDAIIDGLKLLNAQPQVWVLMPAAYGAKAFEGKYVTVLSTRFVICGGKGER